MDTERDRLRELNVRLTRLHKLLLDRERRAYERQHGVVNPHALLQLVLHDARFAWLRSLSMVMAQIDAAVDAEDAISGEDVQRAFREVYRLLKSGDSGTFQEKYRDALQDSPDIVMAHAAVSEMLRGLVQR